MVFGTSQSNDGDISPELRLIQARRRVRLFRVFGLSTISLLGIFAVVALLVQTGDNYSRDILKQLSTFFSASTLSLIFAMVISFVPLWLELQTGVGSWLSKYNEAQLVLDQYNAVERQQDLVSSYRLDKSLESAAKVKEGIGEMGEIAQSAQLAVNQILSDTEKNRWSFNNYPIMTKQMVERLQEEISTQGSRANINLSIALAVAFVGLFFLAWLAYGVSQMLTSPPSQNANSLIWYSGAFVAKLALSVSANIFAFFFLATYRRNLSEIRYFHNELTNVQTQILALYVAIDKGLDTSLTQTIKTMSNTERNFILKKGESTTDLGIKGLDQTEISTLIAMIHRLSEDTRTK